MIVVYLISLNRQLPAEFYVVILVLIKRVMKINSDNILMCHNIKPTVRDVVTQETLNL